MRQLRPCFLAAVSLFLGAQLHADDAYVTIRGQVKLKDIPKPSVVTVTVDKAACCPNGKALPDTTWIVDPKSGGVKNVYVWIRPDVQAAATFPLDKVHPDLRKPKSVQHVIDQPLCQFEPRALAAREGDTLVVKNSAKIAHNVNYSSDIQNINPLIPPGGEVKLKFPLAAQRPPIVYTCNIHPWMKGSVRVFDHPYYALTDADGKFEIKQVPAGKWAIVYAHEEGFHNGKDGRFGTPIDVKAEKDGIMTLKPLELNVPSASIGNAPPVKANVPVQNPANKEGK